MKYLIVASLLMILYFGCSMENQDGKTNSENTNFVFVDSTLITNDEFGESVKLGRDLMLHTSELIGPEGNMGKYLGNKMNCSNCHQEAGTKPFAFNLMRAHQRYPQYRPRENKVLSLADRINNCIERPLLGKPLPYDSKEMIAFLSYFKWINTFVQKLDSFPGEKNLTLEFPITPANSRIGEQLYLNKCSSCHGENGEGVMHASNRFYVYPPLWGKKAYQAGSSMHRITIMASWLKANMPHLIAKHNQPALADEEALHIAAFINNDSIHPRAITIRLDYPNIKNKPFDYGIGPFADTFSLFQHKFGPFEPIIAFKRYQSEEPLQNKFRARVRSKISLEQE